MVTMVNLSINGSALQLEDRYQTPFGDLDKTNEPHFIRSDVAMSNYPIDGFVMNLLTVLNINQFQSSPPY